MVMLCWYCNDLLVPVGIPPSELSDTCKPSHGGIEINQIDLIVPLVKCRAYMMCGDSRWDLLPGDGLPRKVSVK